MLIAPIDATNMAHPGDTAGTGSGTPSATVTDRLEDVEAIWRTLAGQAIESPGQSYDFIRTWVRQRAIAADDQRYVVGRVDGQPVALWPLHRRRAFGLPVFTWFPGANVGCNAPVVDLVRLAALGAQVRQQLWAAMAGALSGADLIYLRAIPVTVGGYDGLFDALGQTLSVDVLYRSQYSSWAQCDKLQRSRSRRKHDRQQGDRLQALGQVSFEEVRNGVPSAETIDTMFRQRSARFKAMGIRDVFVRDRLIGFYHDAMRVGSGIDVRLHVLRLDGEIIAVRYNIVHGDRMFCLISSMSDDPAIQAGSPGKQCLLRVMQTVFDDGISVFDMGTGFTDEKRHWCNVRIEVQHHYIGLTAKGAFVATAHRALQSVRARIKANPSVKHALRGVRQRYEHYTGRQKPAVPGE